MDRKIFSHFMLFWQVHDEREFDRVLAIEGIELIGINNRNLGMSYPLLSTPCIFFFFLMKCYLAFLELVP